VTVSIDQHNEPEKNRQARIAYYLKEMEALAEEIGREWTSPLSAVEALTEMRNSRQAVLEGLLHEPDAIQPSDSTDTLSSSS
jgi:hypothetical protein